MLILIIGAFQVFRRLSSMATRALAYFTRREHCWISGSAGDSQRVLLTLASTNVAEFSAGADSNSDVAMLDATVKQEPGADLMARLSGGLSAHGAILEDMLIWLTLFRYTICPLADNIMLKILPSC